MKYFGIDWSEGHHNLCILNEAGACLSLVQVDHTVEGFQRVEAERLKLGIAPQECLVGIETAHNLIVDYLQDRQYPVYLIPPQATEGYRNRQRSSGARTDNSDAILLASIIRTDRDSHLLLKRNKPVTQRILAQVRFIETLRRSTNRLANQLRAVLLRIYPQALGLFGKLTAQISLQFPMADP